jgi:hypothetical protein
MFGKSLTAVQKQVPERRATDKFSIWLLRVDYGMKRVDKTNLDQAIDRPWSTQPAADTLLEKYPFRKASVFGLFSELTWRKTRQFAKYPTKVLGVFEADLVSNTLNTAPRAME